MGNGELNPCGWMVSHTGGGAGRLSGNLGLLEDTQLRKVLKLPAAIFTGVPLDKKDTGLGHHLSSFFS